MKYGLILFFIFVITPSVMADTIGVENDIKNTTPARVVSREDGGNHYIFQNAYEYSNVDQGSRKGLWRVFSHRIGYLYDNLPAPYIDIIQDERLGETDYAYELGAYLTIPQGYVHMAAGFSSARDFLYSWRVLAECENNILPNINFHCNARFSHYDLGDVSLFSPGLIYYFGNNYIMGHYGISHTEGRGNAQFVTGKLYISANERFSFYLGGAFGQRLYDILLLDASQEDGYISFAGIEVNCSDNINAVLEYSYAEEDPSFIKRSIRAQLKVVF